MMKAAASARRSNIRYSPQWSLMRTVPMELATAVGASHQHGDEWPQHGANHGLNPAPGGGGGVIGPALDSPDDELVQREHREHEQGLLHQCLVAQALVQAHGDVGHQR